MELELKLKIYQVLYRLACYLLLLANLIHLAGKYFRYETDTSVGFYSPINITSPNLSLCFDLNTILSGYEPMVFYPKKTQYIGLKDRYLFSRVPGVQEILDKCAYRDATFDRFKYAKNGSECLSIFNIQRYRMQGLMCYLFQVTKPHTFNFNALSFSLNEPKMLYKLFIGSHLNRGGHTIVPLVHFDPLADVDRMFMNELFPSRINNELYYLNYDFFEIYRLPSPYVTNCRRDSFVRCYYNCLARLDAEYGLSASSGIALEAMVTDNSVVTNYSYTGDPKSGKLLDEIDDTCNKKICKSRSEACEQKLVITFISGPFASIKRQTKLAFIVGSFKYPVSKVIHSAKLSLVDYLTQCFSLSGIWVGFSVIACIRRRQQLDIGAAYKYWLSIRDEMNRKLHLNGPNKTRSSPVEHQNKVHINWVKVIASVLFKLTVMLIFVMQAINQCVLYAQYQTLLRHNHIMNPSFKFVLPATAICTDLDRLFSEKTSQLITEDNFDRLWSASRNLTIAQIFDETMGEEILYKCRVKDYDAPDYFKGIFELKSRDECLKYFKFSKYYSNWQVCYVFKPSLSSVYTQWGFVFRETNPSKLYSLVLNPKTRDLEQMTLILYFDVVGAAYTSSEFPAISQKMYGKKMVMLNSLTNVHERLPRPYDTKCNPFLTDRECRDNCFEAGLREFNLVPFRNTVRQASGSTLLTYQFMKNASVYKRFMQLERKCHEKCLFGLCSTNFTMTYAKTLLGRTEFDVEVVVSVEVEPRIHSISVPRFTFYDFYYQVFCLFSFWLGFTFVGLDFIQKKREKHLRTQATLLLVNSMKLLLILVSVRRLNSRTQRLFLSQNRKSFFKRSICSLICFIGMCLHLSIPFIDYFSYPSILLTTITYENPDSYRLSLCSEGQELYENKIIFGTESNNKRKDIFEKSIKGILIEVNNSLNFDFSCGYWGLEKERNEKNDMKSITGRIFFESNSSSLCKELFFTRIVLNQGLICYQFELVRTNDWTRTQMFDTLNEIKTIFTVSINTSLISPRFTVLADRRKGHRPYHSSVWTPNIRKHSTDARYTITYTLYLVTPLPYPYSDKDFTPGHISHCFYKCTNEKLEKFNLTRTFMGHQPTKHKFVSNYLRRSNGSIQSLVDWVDTTCNKKCSVANFGSDLNGNKLSFTVSLISEPQPCDGSLRGFTRFDLRRTDDPVFIMRFLVSIFIYDLAINVGSIISIWFGLSVINLPGLVTESSVEQMYSEAQDNLKRAKSILQRVPVRNRPKIPVVAD